MLCCANCFTSETLKDHINDIGSPDDCNFCQSENIKCLEVKELYEFFKPIFQMYREIG